MTAMNATNTFRCEHGNTTSVNHWGGERHGFTVHVGVDEKGKNHWRCQWGCCTHWCCSEGVTVTFNGGQFKTTSGYPASTETQQGNQTARRTCVNCVSGGQVNGDLVSQGVNHINGGIVNGTVFTQTAISPAAHFVLRADPSVNSGWSWQFTPFPWGFQSSA